MRSFYFLYFSFKTVFEVPAEMWQGHPEDYEGEGDG